MSGIDHTANCLTHALGAADKISTALCLSKRDGPVVQGHLIDALHSALIVAEEARQAWKERIAQNDHSDEEE